MSIANHLIIGCWLVALAIQSSIAADGHFDQRNIDELTDAINALASQDNYQWSTSIEGGDNRRVPRSTINGSTQNDGLTHAIVNSRRRDTHVVIQGDVASVTDRDGRWETVSLLDEGFRSNGFASTTAKRIRIPHIHAQQLAQHVNNPLTKDQQVSGELDTAFVTQQMQSLGREGDTLRDPKGQIRFWIDDGVLQKYEYQLTGSFENGSRQRTVSLKTTVDISNVGNAKLELPRGAKDALAQPIPDPEPRMSDEQARQVLERYGKRDVRLHDPSSIVRCGDEYWLFSTGNLVSSWRSKDLEEWQRGPRVFSNMPTWVRDVVPDQRGHFWAPDIIKLKDRYLLYYSVSSFGKNTSAIALASTTTLDPDDEAFGWTDHGIVIQSSSRDNFNAIDPAIVMTDAGQLWMSFGSYWSGLKLVQLDSQTGKRISPDSELYSLARNRDIEAAHIFQHDGWYYLFLNWGKCCRGVDSTYNIRVGRSKKITGPYLDKNGADMMDRAGSLLLKTEGPFIGPGHPNVTRQDNRFLFHCHYYDGTQRGQSKLAIMSMDWDENGWPTLQSSQQQPQEK